MNPIPKILIPGSKSHTIRALLIAAMAKGESVLFGPLVSSDTLSCVEAIEAMGATVTRDDEKWIVKGVKSNFFDSDNREEVRIDVGNSGTTLYLATTLAALSSRPFTFDGDEQIRRRSAGNLLNALRMLGVDIDATNGEFAPYTVRGPITGGKTSVECPTSQYLSALLLALPLVSGKRGDGQAVNDGTEVNVPLLYEKPYVDMTLRYLSEQGVEVSINDEFSQFVVPCGQRYKSFHKRIPADFSSATFFFCAAAITGRQLMFPALDREDSQGDKAVLDILEAMGCVVLWDDLGVSVQGPLAGNLLKGGTFDLNAIPDSLPALAVAACFADSPVRLENVPQARDKETDRIAVMAKELTTLGSSIEELEDGMIITPNNGLRGGDVFGHGDHRIIMALSIAGLRTSNPVILDDTAAVAITFPGFFDILGKLER